MRREAEARLQELGEVARLTSFSAVVDRTRATHAAASKWRCSVARHGSSGGAGCGAEEGAGRPMGAGQGLLLEAVTELAPAEEQRPPPRPPPRAAAEGGAGGGVEALQSQVASLAASVGEVSHMVAQLHGAMHASRHSRGPGMA